MALAELLHAIESDAEAQVHALLDAGERDARSIDAAAEQKRTERSAGLANAIRSELQATADVQIAAAERDARARVLAARAAMLERVRDEVRTQLASRADEELRWILERAARSCVTGAITQFHQVATGVELELENGTRIVATLEALLDREWPRLATVVVAEVGS